MPQAWSRPAAISRRSRHWPPANVPLRPRPECLLPPLGQRIAIARDEAFAFIYPHLMENWIHQGAELSFFSPLADEAPDSTCDGIFLPGGYPELHAERLSNASHFRAALRSKAEEGASIYGECGGYMALGDALVDADGHHWPMLGLLPLTTTYATRKRHLGYRRLRALAGPFAGMTVNAHEFHYSLVLSEGQAERMFEAFDAAGEPVGLAGLVRTNVAGSYMHVIDLAERALT